MQIESPPAPSRRIMWQTYARMNTDGCNGKGLVEDGCSDKVPHSTGPQQWGISGGHQNCLTQYRLNRLQRREARPRTDRCNGRGLLEDGRSDKLPKVQDRSHGDAQDAQGCYRGHRPAMQGCLITRSPSLAPQRVQRTADTQQEVEQEVEDLRACILSERSPAV